MQALAKEYIYSFFDSPAAAKAFMNDVDGRIPASSTYGLSVEFSVLAPLLQMYPDKVSNFKTKDNKTPSCVKYEDMINNPSYMDTFGGMGGLIKSALFTPANAYLSPPSWLTKMDSLYSRSNMGFNDKPDLLALAIQRSRDRGVSSYNHISEKLLAAVKTDFSNFGVCANKLKAIYGQTEKVELLVGTICSKASTGSWNKDDITVDPVVAAVVLHDMWTMMQRDRNALSDNPFFVPAFKSGFLNFGAEVANPIVMFDSSAMATQMSPDATLQANKNSNANTIYGNPVGSFAFTLNDMGSVWNSTISSFVTKRTVRSLFIDNLTTTPPPTSEKAFWTWTGADAYFNVPNPATMPMTCS